MGGVVKSHAVQGFRRKEGCSELLRGVSSRFLSLSHLAVAVEVVRPKELSKLPRHLGHCGEHGWLAHTSARLDELR